MTVHTVHFISLFETDGIWDQYNLGDYFDDSFSDLIDVSFGDADYTLITFTRFFSFLLEMVDDEILPKEIAEAIIARYDFGKANDTTYLNLE